MNDVDDDRVHLTRDHQIELLRQMMRIRRFEEKCAELYTQEKIRGFLHLYIGEEANAVGVITSLSVDDAIVATYREHGQALARGLSMTEVMAEMYGKASGSSHGRGGSMHIFSAAHRFYGGNAIVGGGLPLAVGLALADKMQGTQRVTCCFFGEGAAAEGEFHEALNLAALWKLPTLFVCENNLYAMGTAIQRSQSNISIRDKAAAYGIRAEALDGMNVVDVEAGALRAVHFVRRGEGPYLLECQTYRFRAHSMFDPDLYRGKAEIEDWKKRDPILRFQQWSLSAGGVHTRDLQMIEAQIAAELEEAVAFAEAAEWEPIEQLERDVTTSEPKRAAS
ncbi:pyruvate dehydrogenase (acetyl-transferring) E1 component subunit alpha [Rhizobium leguminosarum bv. viciae]|nr:pyruvate dehydrogenase (acetyl-transferring) E1 component subunit alpha [Rhizobium leguminosarum bv. viciae]